MTEPEKKNLPPSVLFLLNPLSTRWSTDFKVGHIVARAHFPEHVPLEINQQQCNLNKYVNAHFEIKEDVWEMLGEGTMHFIDHHASNTQYSIAL